MFLRFFSFFLILFYCQFSVSQIVNIESMRIDWRTNDQLFKMRGGASFSYNNNDGVDNYRISSSLGTMIKSKDKLHSYFFVGNYTLSRFESQDLNNNWFLHFRYNYEQTDLVRWEVFTQGQGNQLLDVELRYLIGGGSRLKLVLQEATDKNKDTGIRCYIGNAYMYEIEKSSVDQPNLYQHRHSSYLSLSVNIPDKVDITNTIYYQPLYEDFGDYRISNDFVLGVPLNDVLELNTSFNYSYDSLTPLNRSQFTSNVSLGLSFTLGSKPTPPVHWHLTK